jgi:putative FmdB family regulatory protein
MPIYEYDCKNCGEQVEILVRSGMNASPVCPNCGSALLEKLFSVPHVMMGQSRPAGRTCCGREERCGTPPCSIGDTCRRES